MHHARKPAARAALALAGPLSVAAYLVPAGDPATPFRTPFLGAG